MSAEWICDGCGKRAEGVATQSGWIRPYEWYERHLSVKDDGTEAGLFSRGTFKTILTACSRCCVETVAAKNGAHSVVLPI